MVPERLSRARHGLDQRPADQCTQGLVDRVLRRHRLGGFGRALRMPHQLVRALGMALGKENADRAQVGGERRSNGIRPWENKPARNDVVSSRGTVSPAGTPGGSECSPAGSLIRSLAREEHGFGKALPSIRPCFGAGRRPWRKPAEKMDRDSWRGGRFVRGNGAWRLCRSSQRSWSSLR